MTSNENPAATDAREQPLEVSLPAATPTRTKPALTVREVHALRAWFAHDSKIHAAAQLSIAPSTLSTHIARVRAKYAATGRAANTKAALFCRAVQDGITDIDHW